MADSDNAAAPPQNTPHLEGSISLPQQTPAPPAASRDTTNPSTTGRDPSSSSAYASGEHGRALDTVSDAELLQAHLAGDPQSFNELIRRHRTLLRIVALRVLENHHDADDSVQDGLLKAFRSAHTYAGRSSVGAWLRTIIENTARTAARDRQRDQRRAVDISAWWHMVDSEQVGADPAEVIAGRAVIDAVLAQIPGQWRHTFELVKVNGLSYAEAAEVLGVPIGTVRSRINRANSARAELRAQIHRDGGNHLGSSTSLL